jgi:hypothetical protein
MTKKTTQAAAEPSQSQQQGDVELSQQPPAPPEWLTENASESGFFVTRIGGTKVESAMEDAVALLKAAATEYAKHTGDTKPYETGVASAIPGMENIGFVALSPEDATTDVARLGRWLMLKLASGQEGQLAETDAHLANVADGRRDFGNVERVWPRKSRDVHSSESLRKSLGNGHENGQVRDVVRRV